MLGRVAFITMYWKALHVLERLMRSLIPFRWPGKRTRMSLGRVISSRGSDMMDTTPTMGNCLMLDEKEVIVCC